jgi:energy-coupling factor transporter ATP-binding protein EcfA2
MNPVLEFISVTIRYPGNSRNTISDVSFQVHHNERVALFGLNGSGKTTLLLAAVGLVPFTGSIFIDRIPVEKKNLQKARDQTGFLFNIPEDQILFPRVLDDVAYGLIRKGIPSKVAHKKAMSVLAMLGVPDIAECSPFQLSHGQRQRIALAGALITNPSLLLLDEPTSGLDPLGKISLADVLHTAPSSIMIATHDVEFASRSCSRFLVLCENEIREFQDCRDAEQCLLGNVSKKRQGKISNEE